MRLCPPNTVPDGAFTFQIKYAAISTCPPAGPESQLFLLGLNTKADQDVCLIIPVLTAVIFVLFWLSFSMLEAQQHQ